ncbi:unnamed protein product [Lactuca virosa]|uniref:Uncharacterized protein n=1 Tax=Lactuca virosa TaxID=75947 RepID=A0AAU9PKW1_9ASTR|nr:unnamed protein product [Lactuca virosa]
MKSENRSFAFPRTQRFNLNRSISEFSGSSPLQPRSYLLVHFSESRVLIGRINDSSCSTLNIHYGIGNFGGFKENAYGITDVVPN